MLEGFFIFVELKQFIKNRTVLFKKRLKSFHLIQINVSICLIKKFIQNTNVLFQKDLKVST